MKSKLSVLLALLLSAGALRAEEPKSSYAITADFAYVSEYIFRGIEQQDGALQPAVTFTKDTLSLGVWSSQGIANRSVNWAQANEIDLWFGYGIAFDKATVSVGGTAYLYPSARASLGEPDNTWELSLGVSGPLGPLTGSATYFHDFVLDADTFEFKTSYSIALPDDRGTVDFGAFYCFNDIGDVNGNHAGAHTIDYQYFGASAAFTYKLTATTALKASINYVDVNDVPGAPGANLWFSLGLTAGL
jgi:uncharacterized protein (TIGR02001 family)